MFAAIDRHRRRTRAGGFTLMEIILVVVIIGIMLTLVAPRITGGTGKAKRTAARNQLEAFKTALQRFEMDIGSFPKELQGLVERPSEASEDEWEGPYLTSNLVPKDPWGREYHYKAPGDHYKDYDLWSDGPDESDPDDDITNWAREE